MQDRDGWRALAADHAAALLADEQKVQRRLRLYGLLSSVAVILGIVAPILAGSTLLASSSHLAGWPTIGGILTLLASGGVALHKGLDCDRYHGKCRQALAELRSLATAYDRLFAGVRADDDLEVFTALETRLDTFYRTSADVLPLRPTRLTALPTDGSSVARGR